MNKDKYIYWLNECSKGLLEKVGGKNANLGELIKAGVRVPEGFAISTFAFKEVFKNVRDRIDKILSSLDIKKIESVVQGSKKIREIMESVRIPGKIEKEIKENAIRLGDTFAVRSSAIAEDQPNSSFAGMFDSYLSVAGKDILNHVKKCWSSLFTPRAIIYRAKNNIHCSSMGVCIQKMINARASGVIFTLNPINGDESKIVIEASPGVGEVVKGEKIPDRYIINKENYKIVEASGNSVNNREIKELARLSKLIENHFKEAQDIEFAIEKGLKYPENIFILQSRAITWSKKDIKSKIADYIANILSL